MSTTNVTQLFTLLAEFLRGLLSLINMLLIPTSWTAISGIQMLIWFGLVFLFVGPVFGLIIRMVRSGSGH